MSNDDFHRLKHLFDEVVELPPAEREAWFARDDIDASTSRRLRALLGADGALAGTTARRVLTSPMMPGPAAWVGRRIGAFVLERELGHGGMGSVFLAQRADNSVEQKVA